MARHDLVTRGYHGTRGNTRLATLGYAPGTLQGRHYDDTIVLTLFARERTYDTAPLNWSQGACAMRDFADSAAHEAWDDLVADDEQLVHGHEYSQVQEIVRQSVRLNYEEPRVKPSTLAAMLGMSFGVPTATQDGTANAYRHAFTPVSPLTLPSISAEVSHQFGRCYRYTGLKLDTLTLSNNGPYLRVETPLVGSGSRAAVTPQNVSALAEPWLRWGYCWLYVRDVSQLALSVPATPVQGTSNLGHQAINISSRVLHVRFAHPNNLWADGGYRPTTRQVRGALHSVRRQTTLSLTLECHTQAEARELGWYLDQRALAFELQCRHPSLIDPSGTFYWGVTLLIPKMQARLLTRGENAAFDTLEFECRVLSDGTNPTMLGWAYTAQPAYLQQENLTCLVLTSGLFACWELSELSGPRADHVGSHTLTQHNGVLGATDLHGDIAAQFVASSQHYLSYNSTQAVANALRSPFTLALWVTPSVLTLSALVTNGNSHNAGQYDFRLLLFNSSGQLDVACNGGASGVISPSTATLTAGSRSLIFVWHDGVTLYLQVNQGAIQSNSGSALPGGSAGMNRFNIGAMGDGFQDFFRGLINKVLLFTRVLTSQERAIVWNNGEGL
jgi:Concanavalin A-like lectin/glucanases superfamily